MSSGRKHEQKVQDSKGKDKYDQKKLPFTGLVNLLREVLFYLSMKVQLWYRRQEK